MGNSEEAYKKLMLSYESLRLVLGVRSTVYLY